ncbi:Oxygen-independent coproporphyrinogen iii oxidase [Thalictrum thalictroides]|uniref:Radical S-adenosyl methionine domain-containing protein 1, mitochondrial n=1 Tax=Thalictrum thalictroides TaxID=46969 RepID=A0A7J6VH77_THATH|nr:Oxygen-independent coproporphyrinogen iii oxidase [Thalictrum thalictroides]
MLKLNFKPFFSTIPNKLKIPIVSFSISSSLQSQPPTVRQNVSLNKLPTTTNSLSSPPPPTSAYIHLPFCRKRCHYCDFTIVALGSSSSNQFNDEDDPRITNYVQLLCREIKATKPISNDNPPLQTIFFGGGTPSLVPPKLVSSIINMLKEKFGVCSNAEISIEMDPGTFDDVKMKELLELGVNRVSLGVQAFQEDMLRKCGRAHGLKEVHDAIEIVKSCGLENWSLDLISSLPHQTTEMWEESMELTIQASPTHVSVYDLQVEQGTKFGSLYTPGEFPLPSDTQSAEFYKMASKTLCNAGYEHYEISSYCKKGYKCKHNVTYWQNRSFYAFGLGSASFLGGVRFSRPKKMKEYTGYVQDLENGLVLDNHSTGLVDTKDMAIDVVMLSLRTAAGLNLRSFGESFGSSLVLTLCKAFKPYVESGHVIALDEKRNSFSADELIALLSNEGKIEEMVAVMRLSDPDGFLLSNELISSAFAAIAP